MKRFFCTTCNKVRRTRFIPSSVTTPFAEKPTDRIGLCAAHMMGLSIAQNVRGERPNSKFIPKVKSPVAPVQTKKGKR